MMMAVAGIAMLAAIGFSIWLVVEAFKVSVGWGLVSFFVPFGALVFAIKYWDRAKKPFLASLAAGAVLGAAAVPLTIEAAGKFEARAAELQAEKQQLQEQMDEAQATDSAE